MEAIRSNAVLRWISVLPGAILAAILITFPVHWILVLFGVPLIGSFVSVETAERLIMSFTTPYVLITAGRYIAPSYEFETSVALALLVALGLGASYVWVAYNSDSYLEAVNYGITPLLNIAAVFAALRKSWSERTPDTVADRRPQYMPEDG